jgi:ketosteroid isomerase-like protein
VRKPFSAAARHRRGLEEHLIVRFPQLFALFARAMSRLRPQSRIRQALLWRLLGRGVAATNRRDFEAALPFYDPGVEFVPARDFVALGIAGSYQGHKGFLNLWNDWDSAWAGHAQWEPKELIDLGDRLVMLAGMRGVGEASGIEVDLHVAVVWTLRNGRAIREEHFTGPDAEAVALGRTG